VLAPYPLGSNFFEWTDTIHPTHDFSDMQRSDFILTIGRVGRRKLAKDEIINNHNELLQAQVDIGDLRYRNRTLEDRVLRLEEQIRDLMLFWTTLQHGLGNPIVVEELLDNEVEVVEDSEPGWEVLIEDMTPEVIQEVREMTPGEFVGRLIPVEEVWEDERNFRRDRATEDINPVPEYPKPPEYIPPPVYDE